MRWLGQWRFFTAQRQPGLFCEHTISLSDEALTEVTAVNETRHLWAGVCNVAETSKHIFIFVAPNAAHVIPKRAFLDPGTAFAFHQRSKVLFEKAHPKAVPAQIASA
jgi:hypothetical protein